MRLRSDWRGRKWWRAPLTHFVALGGLLFVFTLLWPSGFGASEPRSVIVVTAQQIDAIADEIKSQTGSKADRGQLESAVDAWVDDELLFRQALRLKLERGHPGIRTRLLQLARFVSDGETLSDERLYERALDLGMLTADVVVRRQLVTQMRLVARSIPLAREETSTSDEDVVDYVARHPSEFSSSSLLSFTHVYFSKQRRGESAELDARRALRDLTRDLSRGAVDESAALSEGDPFLRGLRFSGIAPAKVGEVFGAAFLPHVEASVPGVWMGPVASDFGWHLLRVDERRVKTFEISDSIRRRARAAIVEERRDARLRIKLRQWRASFDVDVEWERVADSRRKASN